ncbi:MAG: hypothetical protein MJZ33_05550 [Paludibacteraceae bacterium]|nr:hypothetical protein [Paludibacteraceae bacterium]
MRHITFIFLLLVNFFGVANAEKVANVILENSESLSFDKNRGASIQVLKGNVRFRHDNAVMYCDSAYFYDGENSFDAFGRVKVVQGDSITVLCDKMFYDGNARLLRARGNVVMDNRKFKLYTENFDFYRDANYGLYFNGGKIVDPQYELTSDKGYYYPSSKKVTFKNNVNLVSASFTIKSDTLNYNSVRDIASLVGPSHVYYKEYTVYTENGWAGTKTNDGALYDYSVITSSSGMKVTADSIKFDKNRGWAKAYHNLVMTDSVKGMEVTGNYGYFVQEPQMAIVSGSPLVKKYAPKGDTLYLHADTLKYVAIDSTEKVVRAYHNVRFYRKDIQGKCDSLLYSTADSILQMHNAPIIWSDQNQLSGEQINVHMDGSKPKQIHITNKAMIASKSEGMEGLDFECYNQLSSKESIGYMENNQLRRIDMMGMANSIYFPENKGGGDAMMNTAQGSLMQIFLKDKKLEKIVMKPQPKGVLYPLEKVEKRDMFLRDFSWEEDKRPTSWKDVFRHTK